MLSSRLVRTLQKFANYSKSALPRHIRVQRLIAGKLRSSPLLRLTPLAPLPIYAFSLLGSTSDKKATENQLKMAEALQNADQLMDESRYQECLDLLLALPDQNDTNVMWRRARAMQKLSKTCTDKKQKEQYIRNAFALVEEALKRDDTNFAIHKWYAILLDGKAELDGIKSRVSECENVRKHMVRATELNPNDPTGWYILGSLEYSLADMSWAVKKIVSTIFATPPSGTYERALECFLKAESLEPRFYSMNNLMLGKAYMVLKDNEKAKEQFSIVVNVKVANIEDKTAKEEAEKLIKKV